MNDPRIAEVEFLAALERNEGKVTEVQAMVRTANGDMLVHLMAERLIVGPDPSPSDANIGTAVNMVERAHQRALHRLLSGGTVPVRITHAGRVHLWQRRDELRAGRDREPFGILFNKPAFERTLGAELPFVRNDAPLSLLYIDLDHFKSVNDELGHDAGDEVLKRYLTIVRDVIAEHGDAFRIGGDEVAAILPAAHQDLALKLAERIRLDAETELRRETKVSLAPTVSIGVATFINPTSPEVARKAADGALYDAKRAGRNRVVSANRTE